MSNPLDKGTGGATDAPKPLITMPRRSARSKWAAGLIVVVIVALPIYRSCVSRTGGPVASSGGHVGSAYVTNALTYKVEPRQIVETKDPTPEVGQIEIAVRESDAPPSTVDVTSPTPETLQPPENKRLLGVQVPVDEGGLSMVLIADRSSFNSAETSKLANIESGSLWLVCSSERSATLVGDFASGMLSTRMEGDRLHVRLRLDSPLNAKTLLLIMNARWRTGCIMEIRPATNPEDRIAFLL